MRTAVSGTKRTIAPEPCVDVAGGVGDGVGAGVEFMTTSPTIMPTMISMDDTRQPHPLRNMVLLPMHLS